MHEFMKRKVVEDFGLAVVISVAAFHNMGLTFMVKAIFGIWFVLASIAFLIYDHIEVHPAD